MSIFPSAVATFRRPLSPAVVASLGAPGFAPMSAFDLGGAGVGSGFASPLHAVDHRPVAKLGNGKIQVMLVDSDADCLRRFARAVTADASLQLLASAHSSDTAMQCLAQHRPEVLIVEPGLACSFGLALIRHCAIRLPQTDILVRTQVGDDERVMAAIEAGASGYVYKDADADWIVASIHALRDGGALISPGVARCVLARFHIRVVRSGNSGFGGLEAPASEPACPLTEDEIGILRLVACGTSLQEIGEVLAMPPRVVLAQVKGIYRQLATQALQRGHTSAS